MPELALPRTDDLMKPFLELMKAPMSIGKSLIEGGQAAIGPAGPLRATAELVNKALAMPFEALKKGGEIVGTETASGRRSNIF